MTHLVAVLDPPPRPAPRSLAELRARLGDATPRGPLALAVLGGALADRLGFAFAAGYRAALATLAPWLGDRQASLCATESAGAHPRAIATTLRPGAGGSRVDGKKRFATLATEADVLLVLASEGLGADGRNRLRLVAVDARARGVTVTPLAALPFAPEIGHAEVLLDAVEVPADAVQPGDAYTTVLKPFRTIEDTFVLVSLLAYLGASARRDGAPAAHLERTLAALVAASALATADPTAPATHLALAGLFPLAAELAAATPFVDPDERARFARDLPLLSVAGGAREARRLAAWRTLGDPDPTRGP